MKVARSGRRRNDGITMWIKSPGEDVAAVQKVLGEPIFSGLSDRAWRARTQLFGVSIAAIALEKFGLHVNTEATVFGFNLTGVSDTAIHSFVIAALIYLALHFAWLSWESFLEWLLRLTGMRVAFVTVGQFSSEEGDYPSEPSQSTLSNWWKGEAQRIGNLTEKLEEIRKTTEGYRDEIQRTCATGQALNVSNAVAPMGRIVTSLNEVKQSIDQVGKTLSSLRIPASLDRFEQWHKHFLNSQNLRWLFLDVLLPIGLSIYAIILLAMHRH